MNILITTPIFPPVIGGPATYVYELCQRLKGRHEITVVAMGDEVSRVEGVKIIPIRLRYAAFGTFFRQFRLFQAILKRARKADLIYAQGPFVVGLMSAVCAGILRKKLLVKYVGDLVWENAFGEGRTEKFLHDFLAAPNTGFLDRLKLFIQKKVFGAADRIIVPSAYLKKMLVMYYKMPEEKVRVIFNAADFESITEPGKEKKIKVDEVELDTSAEITNKKAFSIVTIGRLVKWKNIGGILRAVKIFEEKIGGKIKEGDEKNIEREKSRAIGQVRAFSLKIIGEGPEMEALRLEASNLGLSERVQFCGKLSHADSMRELSQGDLFILNSLYEGLPHTVIEAMYLGVPVIATNIPGTDEIAIDGRTALLCRVQDEHDLAEKILKMYQDEDLRERLRHTARDFVEKQFSWEKNLAGLGKEFEKN